MFISNCLEKVADCGTREFTDQKREEMQVSDFIRCWLEGSPVQSNVDNHNSDHGSVLYLKDWHFVKVILHSSFSPLINDNDLVKKKKRLLIND